MLDARECMSTVTERFSISPNIYSTSDEDGSTILDIKRDKIYNLIGAGSVMWAKLLAPKEGLTSQDIVDDLSSEFPDVPRSQIESDVNRLLASFQDKELIQPVTTSRLSALPKYSVGSIAQFMAHQSVGLLVKINLTALAALLALGTTDILLKLVSFSSLYHTVKGWPVNIKQPNAETAERVLAAIVTAMTWYPKQAMCLQRSAVTTCLLRSAGVQAEMIIGCQRLPFLAHAWVEVDGEVINDKAQVQLTHAVLDRC